MKSVIFLLFLAASAGAQEYTALHLGYMSNPSIVVKGTESNGMFMGSTRMEYNLQESIKIGFEWTEFQKDRWNNGVFADYAKLKFSKIDTESTVYPDSVAPIDGSLSLVSIGYTGRYRWDQIYVPIYIGWVHSSVQSMAILTKTMRSTIYNALGIGFVVSDKLNVELLFSAYEIKGDRVESGTAWLDPRPARLDSIAVGFKILL